MKNNESARPRSASWAGPVVLLAVAGAAGLWVGQADGADVPLRLAAGLLALAAALGVVLLFRARAARRLFAALDAYAEKEVARAGRRPHLPSGTGDRVLASQRRRVVTGRDRGRGLVQGGT
jgi:predicted membrane metal-binding protein